MTPQQGAGCAATVIAAVLLAGCAAMSVNSYLARSTDFSRYRTYAWGPADAIPTGDPRLDNNPFFHERVQADVDRQLAARGFEKTVATATAMPDLLLHYHINITQEIDVNSIDQKYGYCEDCRAQVYDAGTLTLDLVDARTGRLVWRGWAERSIGRVLDRQEWMERQIDDAVARILERLPHRL